MAKISEKELRLFTERLKPYGAAVQIIQKREAAILGTLEGKDAPAAAAARLALAEDMLDLASNYQIESGVSQAVLKVKGEEALNDARKALYKGIIYLEQILGSQVDAPFSDYEEKLDAIASLDAAGRYNLVRKMGLSIQLLENAYGDNTKWKWAFVDLESRFAAAAKNILDLRSASVMDLQSPDYEPLARHVKLVKKLLSQAADRCREKYELSTGRIDDFREGIRFLGALRRIHIVLNERDEADTVKKKYDVWSAKLEADIKKQEEEPVQKPG